MPFEEARPIVVLEVASLMGSLDQARERASLEQARELAVSIPEEEQAAITRELEDRVLRWSTALGFAADLTPSQVAEAARAALGSTAQSATIARNKLAELRSLFESAYTIRLSPGS